MTNQVAVVEWPGKFLPPPLPKFSTVEAVDDGSTWRLSFPLFEGRDWAPAKAQLAWVGDIVLALTRYEIPHTLHLPAGW